MIVRLPARAALIAAAAMTLASAACGSAVGSPTQLPPRTLTGFVVNGDVTLRYLLERPPGRGPFPAVVVGHGSGEVRKEAFQFISTNMFARGFAVFRYDKRGVGESTGTYSNVGISNSDRMFADLSSDMAAGAEFLRSLPDVDRTRVGLMGVSQAGWIIPLAARRSLPAFMVLIVGPTVTVGQEIYYSRFAEETTTPFEELSKILKEYSGPHGFNPRPVLEESTTPGLWLLGSADRSIPTVETVQILDQLIASGKPYTRVVYPFAGHSLNGANIWADIDVFLKYMKIVK
ncbi:MAG TPA: prolyl oligopeptidase family serine peptidase [Vicinamibacterales bacterium]|nr:prolyl oligopeptidase family serine peptidase [Vicinamibacterales bacterium]